MGIAYACTVNSNINFHSIASISSVGFCRIRAELVCRATML